METIAEFARWIARVSGMFLALSAAAASLPVLACSLVLPPVEAAVSEVATTGYVISGTVIQAFDAKTRQPEIILADQVFVGEGMPREFKIYRTDRDFESRLKPSAVSACQGRVLKEK